LPELPDLTVYIERIAERVLGEWLERVRLASPFVLRTAVPPLGEAFGRRVVGVRRLGKRIVLALEADGFLAIHLMIAGRLHWQPPTRKIPAKSGLASFDFPHGSLWLTESSTRKRASIHWLVGEEALRILDSGGLEVFETTQAAFVDALQRERHTLKRALTDPRILSGIGNAYSDEILHAARLSPLRLTDALDRAEWSRLYRSTREVLGGWTERLRAESEHEFPEKVTAFRAGMAVHGRYGKPCPDCGAKVGRIVYAENETNYCPSCQTGGKLLADRSLSRLLREDWPRSTEELEERVARARAELAATGGGHPRGSSDGEHSKRERAPGSRVPRSRAQ
jgi:formamidopyrimidine-DNA glycosylase